MGITAGPPPTPPAIIEVAPVRAECVQDAAAYYSVPKSVIVAVMAAENGRVGEFRRNTNHTRDNGPMQINSSWVDGEGEDDLTHLGITEEMIRNNGCINVYAGGFILAQHYWRHDPLEAIGRYHSKTPSLKRKYQKHVLAVMKRIRSVKYVLDRANSSIKNLRGERNG